MSAKWFEPDMLSAPHRCYFRPKAGIGCSEAMVACVRSRLASASICLDIRVFCLTDSALWFAIVDAKAIRLWL